MFFHLRNLRVTLGAVLLAGGLSNLAAASDGLHPRTPVEWNDTVCMETVDKSDTSVFALDYDIPFEDTEITPDEVDDSRRHQFFALCRQQHSQIVLPRWITDADVQAAVEKNLVEVGMTDPEDVFETSTYWSGCWHRINADDERRPITDAMADTPVPWDITNVPEGTYTIWGYTWEPAFNVWVQRQGGVVKIHEGGSPESIGPGAAITTTEQIPYFGDVAEIEGCVNAANGSTMVGYYALLDGSQNPGWEPAWVAFTDEIAVKGSSFTLEFPTPEEVTGETVMIRVEVTDGESRSFDAHMYESVIVLAGMNPDDCDDSGGFIGNPGCDDTNGETNGSTMSASTSSGGTDTLDVESNSGTLGATTEAAETGGAADDTQSSGCGCAASGPASGLSAWALLLVAAGFMRRRR